jgi:hypothetical protein
MVLIQVHHVHAPPWRKLSKASASSPFARELKEGFFQPSASINQVSFRRGPTGNAGELRKQSNAKISKRDTRRANVQVGARIRPK